MDLKKITDQHKFLILGLSAFCLLYFILYRQMQTGLNEAPRAPEKVQADTFIPAGYVLVPIKLENTQAVSGLIDQFAIVDVYAVNASTQLNELVAEKVKMLRAPLDPNQFAVLLKDDKARELLQLNGHFSVVLQNRHVIGAVTEVQDTLNANNSQRISSDSSKSGGPLPTAPNLAAAKVNLQTTQQAALSIMKVKVEYAESSSR